VMITLMASVAVLALGAPDPQDPEETIRTAATPGVSAETVAAQGEATAEVEAASPASIAEQDPEPHGLTTDQQISRWLADAPAVPSGTDAAYDGPVDGIAWDSERRVRGEFSAGIGTEGYRQYGASVSVPLGERGHLELHYREVKNGYPAYSGYGYGYGYDPDWMDPVITPWRSEIGLAPIDAREDGSRAWRDYRRTRPAPESER
ncbi:hypothetical protein, partial [Brevundimonas sp.]|uniref:hypothetical protein n=1 Tax=Brevundimonas sp. TaxID=1871086 RepID=UPI003AF9044F